MSKVLITEQDLPRHNSVAYIKALRQELGLTQKEFSEILDIKTTNHYTMIETGKGARFTLEQYWKLYLYCKKIGRRETLHHLVTGTTPSPWEGSAPKFKKSLQKEIDKLKDVIDKL